MSSNNLGRQVKWQDEEGGWHTGRVVLGLAGNPLESLCESYLLKDSENNWKTLVKEDHCGTLTWVWSIKLEPWPDVKYCSACLKEADKCECPTMHVVRLPKVNERNRWGNWGEGYFPLKLECLTGKTLTITEEMRHRHKITSPTNKEIVRDLMNSIPPPVTRKDVLKAALEQIEEEERSSSNG